VYLSYSFMICARLLRGFGHCSLVFDALRPISTSNRHNPQAAGRPIDAFDAIIAAIAARSCPVAAIVSAALHSSNFDLEGKQVCGIREGQLWDPERKSRPCSDRNGLPTETFRILVAQEAIAKASPALLLASCGRPTRHGAASYGASGCLI
jgi:hypothetical protein